MYTGHATVRITRSGTADAPITFLANNTMNRRVRVGGAVSPVTGDVLALTGVSHVVLQGFDVVVTEGDRNAVLVSDSSDVVVERGSASGRYAAAVRVTGASERVTVRQTEATAYGTVLQVDPGATGTVSPQRLSCASRSSRGMCACSSSERPLSFGSPPRPSMTSSRIFVSFGIASSRSSSRFTSRSLSSRPHSD